jgi:predicted alpha/beta hydrolase family esterase
MSSLALAFNKHHYAIVNQDYPSTKQSINDIAEHYIQPMIDECIVRHQAKRIIFVTHSLGGIVLQKYLENHEVNQLTHVIMLGPPNHGSPIVDKLHDFWLFQAALGPAGQALSTSEQAHTLPTNRAYKVSIIAGNAYYSLLSRYFFHEPNDGKVSVSSAYMPGSDDFIVLPVTHTFMMNHALVQKHMFNFLEL